MADNCSHNQLVVPAVLVAFDTDTPDIPADTADDIQDNQLVVHAEHMAVQLRIPVAGMGYAVALVVVAAAVALAEFQKLVVMDTVAAGAEHFHSNLVVVLVLDSADYCNQQLYLMVALAVAKLLYELMLQLFVVELTVVVEIVAAEYCAVADIVVLLHQHDNYLSPVSVRSYFAQDLDYHNQVDMPLLVVHHTFVVAETAELENTELVELAVRLVELVHVVMHSDMVPVVLEALVHVVRQDHEVQLHVVVHAVQLDVQEYAGQLVHEVLVDVKLVHAVQVDVRDHEVLVDVEQHLDKD